MRIILFGLSEDMFKVKPEGMDELESVSLHNRLLVGRKNISLVSQKAIAGYANGIGNEQYFDQLQKFSIPGFDGELIAFEISGDSMLQQLPVATL